MSGKKTKTAFNSFWINLLFILVSLVSVNLLSSQIYFRWDVTADGLYTLSEGTKRIMRKIERPLQIKFYLSENSESVPVFYKEYGFKVRSLLEEYADLNPEFVGFEFFNPAPDSDAEEWADRYGLDAAEIAVGEKFYFGVAFVSGKNEANIPFFDIQREKFLEYDVSKAVFDVALKGDDALGIVSNLPLQGEPARIPGGSSVKWAVYEELEKFYDIVLLRPGGLDISADLETLVLIHPQGLNDDDLYAIDQFVLRGGKLIALVDPMMRFDPAALGGQPHGGRGPSASDLAKLFEHWGVEFTSSQVVGDRQYGVSLDPTTFYPFYLNLSPADQNDAVIAVQGLEQMILGEPGGFTLTEDSPLSWVSLLRTTEDSGTVESFMVSLIEPSQISKNFKAENKVFQLAGLLEGELTSAFEEAPDSSGERTSEHLEKSTGPVSVMLVADADFIADRLAVERVNFLGNSFYQPRNDNLGFFVNMVDFLGGAEDMIDIRSRGRFARPFEVFEAMQKASQAKFNEAEQTLQEKLDTIQNELSQLSPDEGSSTIQLSKEQIESINRFKEDELQTKRELREIRKLLREDIENLRNLLITLNLVAVPLLVTSFGVWVYVSRTRGRRRSRAKA